MELPTENAIHLACVLRVMISTHPASRDEKISILAEALARELGSIQPIHRKTQVIDAMDYIDERVEEIREYTDWYQQWN